MFKELFTRTLNFVVPEKEKTGNPEHLTKKAGKIYVKCADTAIKYISAWRLQDEPFGLIYEEIAIASLKLAELEFENKWQDKVDIETRYNLKKFFIDRYFGLQNCFIWQEKLDKADEFTQGKIGALGEAWITSIKEFAPQLLENFGSKSFGEIINACQKVKNNRNAFFENVRLINSPFSPPKLDAK